MLYIFWIFPQRSCPSKVPFLPSAATNAQLINHTTMAVTDVLALLHKDIAQKPYIFTIPYSLLFWLTVSLCLNH